MGEAGKQSERLWGDRVRRWKASGLPVAEFAAREGIKPSSVGWWKRQLLKAEQSQATTMSFIRVAQTGSVSGCAPSLEVILPSGLSVRATAGMPEARVVALVKSLLEMDGG
jgi:hypothetical protein